MAQVRIFGDVDLALWTPASDVAAFSWTASAGGSGATGLLGGLNIALTGAGLHADAAGALTAGTISGWTLTQGSATRFALTGVAPQSLAGFTSDAAVREAFFAGADVVTGNNSANVLRGFAGNDRLSALGGADTLSGGAGDDTLDGGVGADQMQGGAGNDTFVVDHAGDAVFEDAGAGADTVNLYRSYVALSYILPDNIENLVVDNVNRAVVNLTGNDLDNLVVGNYLANSIKGGDGNDRLDGYYEHDTVDGGAGDDTLLGNYGNDDLDGGTGRDVIEYASAPNYHMVAVVLDGGVGLGAAPGIDRIANFEGVIGTRYSDYLIGGRGDDSIVANDGDDTLGGGIFALDGNDTLDGGAGADAVRCADARSAVVVDLAAGIAGGAWIGSDRLISIEHALGGYADDRLTGSAEANKLDGGFGNGADTLTGAGGADTLFGGGGDDLANGGSDRDSIAAGIGADTIEGGAGADTLNGGDDDDLDCLVYRRIDDSSTDLPDVVAEFVSGEDRIDLS